MENKNDNTQNEANLESPRAVEWCREVATWTILCWKTHRESLERTHANW